MHIQSSLKISLYDRLPSRNLLLSTAVMTLGSAFQHGYYTACLNAPHDELRAWSANYMRIHGASYLADNEMFVSLVWAIGTSLYFIGGAVGSLIAGYLIDKYGHTVIVMISLATMMIPAIIMVGAYFSGINLLFMAARTIQGLLAGLFSCAVPIYLVEIAPTHIRGMICCWYNVMYAIGVALALGFGHPAFLGDNPWIIIMSIPLIPIVIQFLLYSSKIFEDSGLASYYGDIATIVIGALFVLISVLSMILMEVTGRRTLFIYGYLGTFIFSFAHYMTHMYNESKEECVGAVAAIFVCFFVVHYVLGPHSVPWVIIPGMFNQASRPKAMATAAFFNWTMNSVVAISYWPLADVLNAQVLLFFLVPQILFFFLIWKYVPETSEKTITEITEMYK